jgi:outer membrane protein assembly factor BamB
MHTLLLYNDHLYNMGWNGTVNCFDPLTGNEIFTGKLGKAKSFVASPVAADGKIYVIDEGGIVYIIQAGNEFKLLSEIPLGENCLTAPSVTDGMIFFRTQHMLIAVGKK